MESLGIPPEMSNFDCLLGRAGGTPFVLEETINSRWQRHSWQRRQGAEADGEA